MVESIVYISIWGI